MNNIEAVKEILRNLLKAERNSYLEKEIFNDYAHEIDALYQKRIEQVFEGLEELFEPTVPMTLDYEKYHQYKTRTLSKIKEE